MSVKNLSVLSFFVALVLFSPTPAFAIEDADVLAKKDTASASAESPSAKDRLKQTKNITKETDEATSSSRALKTKTTLPLTRSQQQEKAAAKALRTEFNRKLTTIKDTRKKEIVSKIDTKIIAVNDKRTTMMLDALDRMQKLLAKITLKANMAKQNGADTTALDAAIVNAGSSIASASALVLAQKEKEYVITIASESALRASVSATMSSLQGDLQGVHAAVIEAKKAVMNAVRELAKVARFVKGGTGDASGSAEITATPTSIVIPTGTTPTGIASGSAE